MGLIADNVLADDGFLALKNSLSGVGEFGALRMDSFFFDHMRQAESFFQRDLRWTRLGYLIKSVQNGENLGPEWYAVEEGGQVIYLSVSQVSEFGVEDKNTHLLFDEILDHTFGKKGRHIRRVEPDSIILTRSGSPGIALSSNHPTFDYDEHVYIPSGFLITFNVRDDVALTADDLAFYLNLRPVRHYLLGHSAGRCQRNISQEVIRAVPFPEELLDSPEGLSELRAEMQERSQTYAEQRRHIEQQQERDWEECWHRFQQLLDSE